MLTTETYHKLEISPVVKNSVIVMIGDEAVNLVEECRAISTAANSGLDDLYGFNNVSDTRSELLPLINACPERFKGLKIVVSCQERCEPQEVLNFLTMTSKLLQNVKEKNLRILIMVSDFYISRSVNGGLRNTFKRTLRGMFNRPVFDTCISKSNKNIQLVLYQPYNMSHVEDLNDKINSLFAVN